MDERIILFRTYCTEYLALRFCEETGRVVAEESYLSITHLPNNLKSQQIRKCRQICLHFECKVLFSVTANVILSMRVYCKVRNSHFCKSKSHEYDECRASVVKTNFSANIETRIDGG